MHLHLDHYGYPAHSTCSTVLVRTVTHIEIKSSKILVTADSWLQRPAAYTNTLRSVYRESMASS